MRRQQWAWGLGLVVGLAGLPAEAQLLGPTQPSPAPQLGPIRPEARTAAMQTTAERAILEALRADPVTAPYVFTTETVNGRVALKGRVGTKVVYDEAIQVALSITTKVRDDLVIDTAAAYAAAAVATSPPPPPYAAMPPAGGATPYALPPAAAAAPPYAMPPNIAAASPPRVPAAAFPSAGAINGGVPYVYPPPLFGWYDEPFYGFEPPVISYPPWWGAMSARRLAPDGPVPGAGTGAGGVPVATDPTMLGGAAAGVEMGSQAPTVRPGARPGSPGGPQSTVFMDIDPRGVAVLSGSVPTLADAVAVGQKLAQMPGVTEIRNQITYGAGDPPANRPRRPTTDVPPPPPRPDGARVAPPARKPVGDEARPVDPPPVRLNNPADRDDAQLAPPGADAGGLSGKLSRALKRRPALAGLPIRASAEDGVATLSGQVPTAREAMLAFRAAQQTPGVREVIDELEFRVPDGDHPNPLVDDARPEDVEPYLLAQVRRQLGDQAHVDLLRVRGRDLEVRGTVADADDRRRSLAILRSMPLLRDFHIDPTFNLE